MESEHLIDIWRLRNPGVTKFTWPSLSPLVQRRLDYFLISDSLQNVVSDVSIKSAIFTDHSAVCLSINSFPDIKYGPSHWRLNDSLLEDSEYINIISELLNNIQQEYISYHESSHAKALWEFMKYKIPSVSITYCVYI